MLLSTVLCDHYVIMWVLQVLITSKYELLGRGSKSYQLYVWMTGVCMYLGEMVWYDIIWLLYSPRVVVSGERYYACLILWVWLCDSSYESSIGILLQYVRIVCMLHSRYVCCMCIFCYYGEYVFLLIILCSLLLKYGSLGVALLLILLFSTKQLANCRLRK